MSIPYRPGGILLAGGLKLVGDFELILNSLVSKTSEAIIMKNTSGRDGLQSSAFQKDGSYSRLDSPRRRGNMSSTFKTMGQRRRGPTGSRCHDPLSMSSAFNTRFQECLGIAGVGGHVLSL